MRPDGTVTPIDLNNFQSAHRDFAQFCKYLEHFKNNYGCQHYHLPKRYIFHSLSNICVSVRIESVTLKSQSTALPDVITMYHFITIKGSECQESRYDCHLKAFLNYRATNRSRGTRHRSGNVHEGIRTNSGVLQRQSIHTELHTRAGGLLASQPVAGRGKSERNLPGLLPMSIRLWNDLE